MGRQSEVGGEQPVDLRESNTTVEDLREVVSSFRDAASRVTGSALKSILLEFADKYERIADLYDAVEKLKAMAKPFMEKSGDAS